MACHHRTRKALGEEGVVAGIDTGGNACSLVWQIVSKFILFTSR